LSAINGIVGIQVAAFVPCLPHPSTPLGNNFMDTSLIESCDRLRQEINDKISSLQEQVSESTQALRSRRNALAPISRLPPEILAAIFSLLSFYKCGMDILIYPGHKSCMLVTQVCRRWRETSLNHPGLWSRINFTKLTPVGIEG
jgi:hypothetical protein